MVEHGEGSISRIPFVPESRFLKFPDSFQQAQNQAWYKQASPEDRAAYDATVYISGRAYQLGDVGVQIAWHHSPVKMSQHEIASEYLNTSSSVKLEEARQIQARNLGARMVVMGSLLGMIGGGFRVSLLGSPVTAKNPMQTLGIAVLWGIATSFAGEILLLRNEELLNLAYQPNSFGANRSIWQWGAWKLFS